MQRLLCGTCYRNQCYGTSGLVLNAVDTQTWGAFRSKFWDGDDQNLGKKLLNFQNVNHSTGNSERKVKWDGNWASTKYQKNLVQRTPGKVLLFSRNSANCCSICHLKFPEIQTGIFHWMEHTHESIMVNIQRTLNLWPLVSKGKDYVALNFLQCKL